MRSLKFYITLTYKIKNKTQINLANRPQLHQ